MFCIHIGLIKRNQDFLLGFAKKIIKLNLLCETKMSFLQLYCYR